VRRSYASFSYQAGSWTKPRRVVAKVECHAAPSAPTPFALSFTRSPTTSEIFKRTLE
jgi:hypothetical protein